MEKSTLKVADYLKTKNNAFLVSVYCGILKKCCIISSARINDKKKGSKIWYVLDFLD